MLFQPFKTSNKEVALLFPPFYEAFNVQPGDKKYKPKAERIKIW